MKTAINMPGAARHVVNGTAEDLDDAIWLCRERGRSFVKVTDDDNGPFFLNYRQIISFYDEDRVQSGQQDHA